MVHSTKYFPLVFRGSQTQGDHFPRYPNLNMQKRTSMKITSFGASLGEIWPLTSAKCYFSLWNLPPLMCFLQYLQYISQSIIFAWIHAGSSTPGAMDNAIETERNLQNSNSNKQHYKLYLNVPHAKFKLVRLRTNKTDLIFKLKREGHVTA
jgi:hypothetical protein